MEIVSIDNMYEEDGCANLMGQIMGLNLAFQRNPSDPTRTQIVAILPEYDPDGRLNRLDVLLVPAEDPGTLTADDSALMTAAAAIVTRLQEQRAAAIAAADDRPPMVVATLPPAEGAQS